MLDIKKRYIIYITTIFIIGIVYEMFSHNVYTPFMYLAFIIPLIGLLIINYAKLDKLSIELINLIVLSFTIGSIFKGILYIYGTTNKLLIIYVYIGIISLICLIINIIYHRLNNN